MPDPGEEPSPGEEPDPGADEARETLLAPPHRALTLGLTLSVTLVAFLWLGVTTVLPKIADELDGLSLFGWAFTGFMLANMVGTVITGRLADRTGAVRPYLIAFAVFVAGCAAAAAAPTWHVLLVARAAQGFGVGGVLTLVYLGVGRAYPERLRSKMLALVASCWTLPALVGPVILGRLADAAGWRAVFVVFVPLVPVAAALTLPGLRRLGPTNDAGPSNLWATVALAVGAGAIMAGLSDHDPFVLVPLVAAGTAITVPVLRRLLPAGTLRLRRGLPSAVAVRGLVSVGYYGSEAFFPLAMTTVWGLSSTGAGLALAVGAVTWVAGAWLQARVDERGGDRGRRLRVVAGFGLLVAGLGVLVAAVALHDALPVAVAAAGWGVGGLGMGLVYPSVTTLALGQARAGEEGATSASLQLSETLSVAVMTGLGGAVVALGVSAGWEEATSFAVVFAMTAAASLFGIGAGTRTLARPSEAAVRAA
ncbi:MULTISPECIES: MFS transporter [Actinomadura]|uniref:MFS transporter n=1 Tax=Actinomadura yumaensis TaxID=111807 RepID=A0ABW2CHJ3_9ACTN|nr:MFS transporter [Actinomadura sp. J1-007]MWK33162.1 MFS transporter [Actinomadura sp. J1-007]